MSKSVEASAGGIGLGGLVFLALLILKLTKLAAISWFWVFFPLWIGLAAVLAITGAVLAVAGFIWLVAAAADAIGSARRERRFNRQLKR